MILLKRGAEAEIWLKKCSVVKKRVRKAYRIAKLDRILRERRNRRETRLLKRASECGVMVPRIIREGKYFVEMEYIEGNQLKDVLNEVNHRMFAREAGRILAKLHNADLIHGDFTTSNLIVKDGRIYVIDFGLGFVSTSIEDKATDLRVFEETTKATHPRFFEDIMEEFITGYLEEAGREGRFVVERLKKIKVRTRYRKKL